MQGPSVPGVGKPSRDAGPHFYPLGRAEGTEDRFATALPPTKPRGQWGGAGPKCLLKRLSRKSVWFVAATGIALRDSDSKSWTHLQRRGWPFPEHLTVCQALCRVFPSTIPATIPANPEGNHGHAQLIEGQTMAQRGQELPRDPGSKRQRWGLSLRVSGLRCACRFPRCYVP